MGATGQPVEQAPHIAVQDLDRLQREDAALQIADVRRPADWEEEHIAGALLLPLNQIAIAASLLLRAGFRQVVNVTGGFDAWKAAGLPVAQVVLA